MGYKYNPFTGELDRVGIDTLPPEVPTEFDTDSGIAIPAGNVLNIHGTAAQGVRTSGAGNTVAITNDDATTTQKGVVRLATNAEAIAGTISTNVAIVPSSLTAKLGVQTAKGVPYGAGTAAALAWTNALTNGQLVIGSTAGTPQAGQITSTGSTITVTLGSNTINLETAGTVATSYGTNSGSAVPAAGIIRILGGTGCTTTGATNVVTINLAATVPLSFPTDSGTAIPALNALTILGGVGCSSSGAGSTVTINADASVALTYTTDSGVATPTSNNLNVLGTSVQGISTSGTGATVTVTAANASNSQKGVASFNVTNFTATAGNVVSNAISVTSGANITATASWNLGGATSIAVSGTTNHAIQIGNVGGSLTSLAAATNGQIPIGSTGADPVIAAITAGTGISVTNGAGSITIAAGASVATTYSGNTGSATPAANVINLVGTGSLTSSATGSTVTFALTGLTNHSLLVGAGTATITNLGVAANGAIPIGSAGADPVLTTITAGTGISVTNGAGSITIAATTGAPTWINQGTSTTIAVNTNYFATGAATLTLPASPAQGDTIEIDVDTASTVILQANTGQVIRLGNTVSSTAGTMTNSAQGDAITLTYRATGTTWHGRGSQGNWVLA